MNFSYSSSDASLFLKPISCRYLYKLSIFSGDIKPYIEVNREYFENVRNPKIYVVYEAFELYREVYPDFNVKYNGKWIEEIKGNYSITLPAPSRLNPWKPLIGGLALAAIIGLAIWALSKPRDKK